MRRVDPPIGLAQAAHRAVRRGHGIGQLPGVPHRPSAGRAPDGVDVPVLDPRPIVPAKRGLMPAEREAMRRPAVQPQDTVPGSCCALQQGHVDSHVAPSRAGLSIEQEVPDHPADAISSIVRQVQTRLRSPKAPSIRPTVGHTLPCRTARRREGRALARVGPGPVVADHLLQRVRRVGEQVVVPRRRCPPRSRGSPPGSRSSRRRSDPAPPWIRSRSARSSACRRPGRRPSADGIRSR